MVGTDYDLDGGLLVTTLRLSRTVLPGVASRPAFWIGLSGHLTIWWLYRHGILPGRFHPDPPWVLEWNEVKVVVAITTFFEVFYISHCYTRYVRIYHLIRDMLTDLTWLVLDLRLRVRGSCPRHVWLACRYMVASTLSVFERVDPASSPWRQDAEEGASSGDDLESVPATSSLRAKRRQFTQSMPTSEGSKLLRPEELAALHTIQEEHRPYVLFYWSLEAMNQGYIEAKAPPNARQAAVTSMFKAQAALEDLIDTFNFPVPFQYFHLLNLMICVSLAVLAYVMGTCRDLGSPVMFLGCELTYLGLLELAAAVSNPFRGGSEVDFPVGRWLMVWMDRLHVVLETTYREDDAEGWEPVLAEETRLGLYEQFRKSNAGL